jgi:hypothetical protein
MASAKVMQLINKYSANPMTSVPTALLEQSEGRFKHQQKKIAEFAHNFQTKFRVLIIEMEHDLSTLRLKKFNKEIWKMMAQVWENLVNIYKTFHQDKPYEAAAKLVEYVNTKQTKDIIDNIDFLAQHHMKKTPVKFTPMSVLNIPEIKSLKLLTSLSEYLQNYMKENSLLEKTKEVPISYPPLTPTWRPPAMTPEAAEPEKEVV